MKRIIAIYVSAVLLIVFSCLAMFPSTTLFADDPSTPPENSTFEQRLELRKKEQNIEQLDEKTKKSIIDDCTSAKTSIGSLVQSTEQIISKHNSIYQKIYAQLWVTIGQLKLANQDTSTIEEDNTEYSEIINKFKITGQNFQQSLNDILIVKCDVDAEGFQALLETSRAYLEQLLDQSNETKEFINNNIKSTLDAHITQLTSQNNTEGQ